MMRNASGGSGLHFNCMHKKKICPQYLWRTCSVRTSIIVLCPHPSNVSAADGERWRRSRYYLPTYIDGTSLSHPTPPQSPLQSAPLNDDKYEIYSQTLSFDIPSSGLFGDYYKAITYPADSLYRKVMTICCNTLPGLPLER